MKIVRIFADQLFAFKYENEVDNELRILLTLWNDIAHSVFDTDSFFEFLNEQQ